MTTAANPRALAVLTLRGAGSMDRKQRREIADWLHRQAEDLIELGDQYDDRSMIARYYERSE